MLFPPKQSPLTKFILSSRFSTIIILCLDKLNFRSQLSYFCKLKVARYLGKLVKFMKCLSMITSYQLRQEFLNVIHSLRQRYLSACFIRNRKFYNPMTKWLFIIQITADRNFLIFRDNYQIYTIPWVLGVSGPKQTLDAMNSINSFLILNSWDFWKCFQYIHKGRMLRLIGILKIILGEFQDCSSSCKFHQIHKIQLTSFSFWLFQRMLFYQTQSSLISNLWGWLLYLQEPGQPISHLK